MKYIIKNINDYKNIDLNEFNSKLKHNDDKLRSYLGILSLKELDKSFSEDLITYNEYGKPLYKDYHIYFNISHSYDYVVTSISKKEIGIDIEKIREVPLNTIKQFATKNEQDYILLDSNNIYKRLFQIYTLKEAYFKMKGTNLNEILNVEFKIEGNSITCSDSTVNSYFINELNNYIVSYVEKK